MRRTVEAFCYACFLNLLQNLRGSIPAWELLVHIWLGISIWRFAGALGGWILGIFTWTWGMD